MEKKWYPGHMARAKGTIAQELRVVDVVLEVVDSRAPAKTSSRELLALVKTRPVIKVMTKADLADLPSSRQWMDFFRQQGITPFALSVHNRRDVRDFKATLEEVVNRHWANSTRLRGRRPLRAMVVGFPNVGKSSLINWLTGRSQVAVGAKPGVTRGKQWIRVLEEVELLDTPGVLWPGGLDEQDRLILGLLGILGETAFSQEEAVLWLLDYLRGRGTPQFYQRYPIQPDSPAPAMAEEIARSRGLLQKGGIPDYSRAIEMVLKEFRQGLLGRYTLEHPPEIIPS